MSEPSSPDIVAFLDRWLAANYDETSYSDIKPVTVRRARDEIVALREDRDTLFAAMEERGPAIRVDALEEAARLHEQINPASDDERIKGLPGAGAMGAVIEYRDAIRALKEKP